VFTVATVPVDLSTVPDKDFDIRWSPTGKRYFSLSYDLEISAQSSLEFFMTINGNKHASLTASFE
jgi:hypothetical protein